MELIILVVGVILLIVTCSMYYLEREKAETFRELSYEWEEESSYWEGNYFDAIHELNRKNIQIGELELALLSSMTKKSETKSKTKNKK